MTAERFPVEAGHIMMFARAIRDPNPIYYDAEHAVQTEAGGVIAPPTFIAASAQYDPDYPLRPKLDKPWMGSGRNPTSLPPAEPTSSADSDGAGSDGAGTDASMSGDARSLLHAEQHYEYHAPLLAGMVLTATEVGGNSWTKQGRRGGTLQFHESITEFRDEAGELIVTARSVGVHTGRVVEPPADTTAEQPAEQQGQQQGEKKGAGS